MKALLAKTDQGKAVVGVVGLGYVGLPLAAAFADKGLTVIGVDADRERVAALNEGRSYIADVPSERLQALRQLERISASADYSVLAGCDVVFICVPTPYDEHKTPDLSYIRAAAEGVAAHLRPGMLVILQSTTYPGTTEEVMRPVLEHTGLRVGVDFALAFSPERVDPGNRRWTVINTPKVVGGVTPTCGQVAAAVLRRLTPQVHVVSSPGVAEMTKLLENIFRSVNIALVNELALLCERLELDIWEVIEAASTKPFGFMPFYPGPGVGGHCIPVDPYYLSWKALEHDFHTRFIQIAAETNDRMPFHLADRVVQVIEERGQPIRGARILVLGVAFKPDVSDTRNSPSRRVIELLLSRGAEITYHDPYVPRLEITPSPFYRGQRAMESAPLDEKVLLGNDCTAILVGHQGIDYGRLVRLAPLVLDAVNATRGLKDTEGKVYRLGAGLLRGLGGTER